MYSTNARSWVGREMEYMKTILSAYIFCKLMTAPDNTVYYKKQKIQYYRSKQSSLEACHSNIQNPTEWFFFKKNSKIWKCYVLIFFPYFDNPFALYIEMDLLLYEQDSSSCSLVASQMCTIARSSYLIST